MKIVDYIKGSFEELQKVTWPSKKEIQNYTVLVIVISLLVASFLGGLDYIFNILLAAFIK